MALVPLCYKTPNISPQRVFTWHGWDDLVTPEYRRREHLKAKFKGYRSYSAYRMAQQQPKSNFFSNRLCG